MQKKLLDIETELQMSYNKEQQENEARAVDAIKTLTQNMLTCMLKSTTRQSQKLVLY